MALVLAIEPDLRQAAILRRIVKEQVKADLVVVDSRDAAIEAIRRGVPDVLLFSALMSPRDEDELIQHLRALDGADHLQTHTIPQLASTLADTSPSKGGGLLRAFRRKKEPELAAGCDPDLFADEIRTFVKYAAEKKEERRVLVESGRLAANAAARSGISPRVEQAVAPTTTSSSWDDPFAWNPTGTRPQPAPEPAPEPEPHPAAAEPDPWSTDYRRVVAVAPVVETEPAPEPTAEEGVRLATPEEPEVEPAAPVMAASELAVAPETIAEPEPEPEPELEAAPVPVAVVEHDSLVIEHEPLVVEHTFAATTPVFPLPTPRAPETGTPVQVAAFAPEPQEHLEAPVPVEPEPIVVEHQIVSAAIESEPIEGAPEPIAASPRAPISLGPLATWVRFEASAPTAGERTTTDELRELMSNLSIPPHVAGVTYARGCRIRRVRVPGGRDRRKVAVPGPVILSRRQLEKERQATS